MQWPVFGDLIEAFRSKRVAFPYQAIPLVDEGAVDQLEAGDEATTKLILRARSSSVYRTSTTVLSILGHIWNALRPTFIWGLPNNKGPVPPTAWLNGVRGCAALNVVIYHTQGLFYPGHGTGWSSKNPHFFELPIIRLFYHGAAMVTIFFIVSGYSLSYKPILLIGKGEYSKVYDSLASSIFRRAFRLFIPCATIALLMLWIDYFDLNYPPRKKPNSHFSTIWGLLSFWFDAVTTSVNPCHYDIPYKMKILEIDYVFWTIPTEYRGSLFIFGLLLVMAKCRPSICLGTIVVVLLWLTYCGQSDIWLFVSGTLCCALKHLIYNSTTVLTSQDAWFITEKPKHRLRGVLVSIVAPLFAMIPILYVLTQPSGWLRPLNWEGWGDAPFYPTLNTWTPAIWRWKDEFGRFWRVISATLFILLVDRTVIFRRFFELSFPQYLGKISFSLYLIQFVVIKTTLTRLKPLIYEWTTWIHIWWIREVLRLGLCAMVFFPILFWVSELSTRYVDEASVRFARWLEGLYWGRQTPQTKPLYARPSAGEPRADSLGI